MQISPTISTATPVATSKFAPYVAPFVAPTDAPAVPKRWARWWKAPIAAVDYGAGSRIAPWREAWIPTERTLKGGRAPLMVYGGTALDTAVQAAHALAYTAVRVRISESGHRRTVQLNPAMAVLRDASTGAYWITPLTSTVKSGEDWVEVPHSIDGAAFTGAVPWLQTPDVLSASKDLVVVVGRERVLTPSRWADAPDDSRGHAVDE